MYTVCVKVFYCSCGHQQDTAVNKTWQWSKPSFRSAFRDWQALFYSYKNIKKRTYNYGGGMLGVRFLTLQDTAIFSEPNYGKSFSGKKTDKESALGTLGTKWLQRTAQAGNMANCMEEIQAAETALLTKTGPSARERSDARSSLNEQDSVSPVMLAAEKSADSSQACTKANTYPVIKRQALFHKKPSQESPSFQAIHQNLQ